MARTALTVYDNSLSGNVITANETTGTADGHSIAPNTGDQFIFVRNSNGAAARDVIIKKQNATVGGADYADETISIPLSASKLIGPFERAPFNTSANLVHIDFDSGNESDLHVVAFRFTRAT